MVTNEYITTYIPHREPFIMVDTLISVSHNNIITSFSIPANNIFVNNNKLSYYGVLEHIAQSAALGYGYLNGNRIGMIGKITKCTCWREPNIYKSIKTSICIEKTLESSILISAKCLQGQADILECHMYLYFQ